MKRIALLVVAVFTIVSSVWAPAQAQVTSQEICLFALRGDHVPTMAVIRTVEKGGRSATWLVVKGNKPLPASWTVADISSFVSPQFRIEVVRPALRVVREKGKDRPDVVPGRVTLSAVGEDGKFVPVSTVGMVRPWIGPEPGSAFGLAMSRWFVSRGASQEVVRELLPIIEIDTRDFLMISAKWFQVGFSVIRENVFLGCRPAGDIKVASPVP